VVLGDTVTRKEEEKKKKKINIKNSGLRLSDNVCTALLGPILII
jgi:uncharacterized membrane protein